MRDEGMEANQDCVIFWYKKIDAGHTHGKIAVTPVIRDEK